MAKETRRCTPRVAAPVERVLIPLAIEKEWTPGELAAAARKAVIEADPDGAQDQAREAKKRSDVTLFGEPCEMATLTAYGSGVTLTQLLARIDARARQLKAAGDARTIGELRIEAMREAILGGDTSSWPMVRTDLTLDVETFLGLNRKPGELVGYGPITAETARELAEDSQMRRLLTDPLEGVVVDVGRRHYRPTKRQHDIVNTVHKTCSMPGCCKPAIHCDRDHRFSWGEGGATSTCNLHPLCRRHHNLKTKRYWRIDQMPDGTEVWTSPLGRQFTKRHPTYPDGLIQPLDDEDDLPEDVAYRLPEADPDPPRDADGIPYPTEPPPLTAEELEEFEQALDIYRAFGAAFINNANQHYDEARALGLIA
jgi:hypothetical protein